MTDQTTTNADANEAATAAQVIQPTAPVAGTSDTKAASGGGKALGVIAILFSLAALGGSGYNFYLSQLADKSNEGKLLTGVNDISGNVKVLAERMNQLQRSQRELEQDTVSSEQLETSLLSASNKNDIELRDIKAEQQGLKQTLEKFAANTERSADKLALDEVSQLLKLANNSAVFSGDRVSAVNALKIADSQLKQLADPRYAVVRRTINKEINELEAIESVDVTSLTAELHAIAKRIPSLPLENEPPVTGSVEIAESAPAEDVTLTSELKAMWLTVLNAVKISRVDQPPKPLLAPEQRYFLDQNIQLKLTTAELAVMQNKAQVYERSIDDALTWLLDYYDPRNADVTTVAEKLRALKGQPLGVELPSVAGSYDQLQRLQGGN